LPKSGPTLASVTLAPEVGARSRPGPDIDGCG
jgi:hypothetical protein